MPLKLVLIDDDPIFRLGLRLWLNHIPDFEVLAELGDGESALQFLQAQFAEPDEEPNASSIAAIPEASPEDLPEDLPGDASETVQPAPEARIELVLLSLSLGERQPGSLQGLDLCQQIKAQYPELPILMLSVKEEPVLLVAAQQAGADGYCLKQSAVADLDAAIRQVAAHEPYWTTTPVPVTIATAPLTSVIPPAGATAAIRTPLAPLAITRRNLRESGLHQIETALIPLTAQLRDLNLNLVERAIVAGRSRELRVARWVVQRLLATPQLDAAIAQPAEPVPNPSPAQPTAIAPDAALPVTVVANQEITTRSLQALLFDTMLSKLQTNLQNQTETPLEIDILRDDKKRELLYLILRKLEDLLSELRYSQVVPEQLPEKRSVLLIDLWQMVLTNYFGKYFTLPLGDRDVEVVPTLLLEAPTVTTAILSKIPFVTELLAHLLFQAPLLINGRPCAAGNPEALTRAELLLDHLVLQVANAVIQPFLNRFADIDLIKEQFYDQRLLSSREIERFRNDLSWKYRIEQFFREPRDIFESQYRLLTLYGRGIKRIAIYAPRQQELEQLSGIPLTVTLALETRDAIAPRLRSAIAVVGSGLVYVLTEVIGRSIGLVGRGILKGLGNVWVEQKSNRNR